MPEAPKEKFVLVIEDCKTTQQAVRDQFERQAHCSWGLLQAFTLPEARELIAEHGDKIKNITFSHGVSGDDGDDVKTLAHELMVAGHKALMVATSYKSRSDYANHLERLPDQGPPLCPDYALRQAGCFGSWYKNELARKILDQMDYFDVNELRRRSRLAARRSP